jgi:ribosome-binding protein aMBF1 (putative translation factor)
MSAPSRTKNTQAVIRELPHGFTASSPAFDRELAAKIGKHIAVRRSLCGLSKQQLAARMGVDPMEVEAYERGERRINCKLLLETAKQLKATPRFFFQ